MSKPPLTAHALGYSRADKRLEILQRVGEEGSISQAARSAGVSYKAAWQAIHTLTNLAGEPLVDSSVGGAGGGGAQLTPAGERLLHAAQQLALAREQVFASLSGSPALAHPRTSMRNALRASVLRLESAGARDPMIRVVLALPQGATLTSLITRESAELLDLSAGQELLALCKATAVQVVAGAAAPDGNQVPGRVHGVTRGHARDEVMLTLDDGQQLVGFSAASSPLRQGDRAHAAIDERVVVLGLG